MPIHSPAETEPGACPAFDETLPPVLRLSTWTQHSSHLRHAIKNSIGVAALSVLAYLPTDSDGYSWFTSFHGQWVIISYVWVLETNTGATWCIGYLRLSGTVLGAVYSYIVCHDPYGIVAMVTLTSRSVTLPPVVLTHYLISVDLALARAVTIAIGIVSALAMNGLVFPRHSRALKLELHIRNALQRSKILLTMNDELSLVPKPMRHYREVVLDLMMGLRKIREPIPRKETVACVLKERRNFVSCVCLTLFASEQVFRARQPFPQFLPSARKALEVLTAQIEFRLWQAFQEDKSPMKLKLSLVYSLAEREVMKDMVDTPEELLELCRALFGTSAWLTQTWLEMNGVNNKPTSPGTPGDMRYSTLGRV
ncbi:hypothetical protein BS17DRAFT_793616 [Gyrodon lividus]|nr:hypothetical protein BS17DRAFT_793616 [Gyrodon lividus]